MPRTDWLARLYSAGLASAFRSAGYTRCHVSFFEADAFARWRGCRLPTEAEWESVASGSPITGICSTPEAASRGARRGSEQLFGDCWEWTASPYTGYPGYKSLPGALGEYNGKFMSSQMILRGGSCVTPASHCARRIATSFRPRRAGSSLEYAWRLKGYPS